MASIEHGLIDPVPGLTRDLAAARCGTSEERPRIKSGAR